ncbi:MAG TPA: D-alanyl-D-alanine carboxypeptidase/D-alanyl-D-alanine-endopeptidase [Methanoregulaceae archaeon]|nr:D-alanyl-D-alanine carboxypeptidase/D-alanyl-D-alanine-endopeptidase [Methanoregulaceae archaeon]
MPSPSATGAVLGTLFACLILCAGCMSSPAAQTAPASSGTVAAAFDALAAEPQYQHATWGVLVVDLANNTTLYGKNPDAMLMPGSTTKCFSSAAALAALGPDHRFETPVYTVNDTLVLVASGDPTLGGRTRPDGTVDFTNIDHGDANALGGAPLTPEDPLGGLDDLARQVKASGIASARDVLVDDRVFETTDLGKEYVLSPMIVNDNLIDITVAGAEAPGGNATVRTRPETALFRVVANVTSTSGVPADLTVEPAGPGVIAVSGTVPAGAIENRTFAVPDPAAFGRALLIEALRRQGVGISANATGPNPDSGLPTSYAGAPKVASFVSPPFAEDVKLTLKVSQNYHADIYVLLLGAANGTRTFADGMARMAPLLRGHGVDTGALSLVDGEGSDGNRVSPRAAVQLLAGVAASPDAAAFANALPVLGVDGTLADSIAKDSPAVGKVRAKTGTTIGIDALAGRPIVWNKALAGYADCASGRRVAFALCVNNVPVDDVAGALAVGNDLAALAAAIRQGY